MKKIVLSLGLLLLSFSVVGCSIFASPYDKMMNKFERLITLSFLSN